VTLPSARDLGASAFWSSFGARVGEFEVVREDRPTLTGRTLCVTAPLYNTDRLAVMIMPHAMQPLAITRTAIGTATLRHERFMSMGTSAKGKADPITGTRGQGFQPDWGKCWVFRQTNDRLKGRPAFICSREAATVAPGLRITAHLSGSRRWTSAPAAAFCYTGEEPNHRAMDRVRASGFRDEQNLHRRSLKCSAKHPYSWSKMKF